VLDTARHLLVTPGRLDLAGDCQAHMMTRAGFAMSPITTLTTENGGITLGGPAGTVAIADAGFSYKFSASVPAGGVDSFRYGPTATVAALGTGALSAPAPGAHVSRAIRRY